MQRKNWREMFCTTILEGDNGGDEEFPPADMRGVPQPPLTAKVMLIKIMPFFLHFTFVLFQRLNVENNYLTSVSSYHCWVDANVTTCYVDRYCCPGLCHHSLHAGPLGILHTLDTQVRMHIFAQICANI